MLELAIVIPCYNEGQRLNIELFHDFITHTKGVQLLFVNDGSRDNTLEILRLLETSYPQQVTLIDLLKNEGKAEAVRHGMKHAIKLEVEKVGYLDADLSTSLEECYLLSKHVQTKTPFVFGSRIMKIDNRIERKWYRFLLGRLVATVISKMLRIKVYDTQCGCKIFTRTTAQILFQEHFLSKWLFDVELFYRMIKFIGRPQVALQVKEIPLQQWIDTADSRIEFSYGFFLWLDLIKIYRHYR